MANFYQGTASDPGGIFDWVFDAVGNIGSIFGQLLFVTFWLSLFLIGAGALFLIWLNVRHAKECDVQDSQDTRTQDLLRELAPADQRFSIVGGKAVKFEGEIPELQEPAFEDSAAEESPEESTEETPVDEKIKYAPPTTPPGSTSDSDK